MSNKDHNAGFELLTFSGSSDALPQGKVTNQVDNEEADDQLPFDCARVVNSLTFVQLQNIPTERDNSNYKDDSRVRGRSQLT